ncbi:MAG: hypothetical protein ABI697_02985 [Devosia sp.]
MDRVISLLAALVGLIALAGAVLVHVNNQSREQELVAEVAALQAQVASAAPAPKPVADDGTIDALLALQKRIAALEQAQQAPSSAMAVAAPADAANIASTPAQALAAGGPTTDCIPLGTRFMGTSGDRFPLCKTKMVLKVAAVSDGLATIDGAGDVAQGSTVPYAQGCTVTVFSADTSGYAEMRVACQ